MPRSFRVPSSAHPVDTSSGRTLAPGEVVKESDLTLRAKADDEEGQAAVAHDQRLVDEVLIDLGGGSKPKADDGGDGA